MKRLAPLFFLLAPLMIHAQSGILKKMHDTYAGKWHKTFSFQQETKFYRNDSLVRTETWNEFLRFPYELRIDMGDREKGAGVIYKKDSTYRFQGGKIRSVGTDHNPFLFLIGGMYMMPYDSIPAYLKRQGYDMEKSHQAIWKGRPVTVVGALAGDTLSNQLWIDNQDLYLVRMIEKLPQSQLDVHMTEQVKIGKGWTETFVLIYTNGKLRQTEKYHRLSADVALPDAVFDPAMYIESYKYPL